MAPASDSAAVVRQYEHYPYPERDPADEKTRLISTWLDDLRMVNHHCFRGAQRFDRGFRVLVAGGGTGDGSIYLGEQLRHTDAEIVHLDFSRAALEIARARAEVRGLTNIRFVEASLLALPELGLGAFDLINCVGVLHHLAEPERGMQCLLEALAPDGALVLLVYAQYGRTGVYQMQNLLRMINRDLAPDAEQQRIERARALLAVTPASNWFRRGEDLHNDHKTGGDAGLFDLLLHSQDRAYTVPELYEWLADRCGLHLQFSDWQRGRLPYDAGPLLAAAAPGLRAAVAARSVPEQQAIAELLRGDMITHSLYATRGAEPVAPYGDTTMVPMLINDASTGMDFVRLIEQHRNEPFLLMHHGAGLRRQIDPGRHVKSIFAQLDGERSFGEIFARVRAAGRSGAEAPGDELLFAEFQPWYEALEAIERIALRTRDAYPGIRGYVIR